MSGFDVFSPFGATQSLAVTTTTGNVALTVPGAPITFEVRLFNDGSSTAFIAFGSSTVEATATSLPIPSGGVEIFAVNPATTHIAAITASGTTTIYATSGRGA